MFSTIYRKILFAFVPSAILLLILGFLALNRATQSNQLAKQNYTQGLTNVKQIGDAITSALRVREHLLLLNNVTANEEKVRQKELMDSFDAQTLILIDDYRRQATNPNIITLLDEFARDWQAYQLASINVIQLSLSGETDNATTLLIGDVSQHLNHAIDILLLIQDIEDNLAIARYDQGQELYQNTQNIIIIGTASAILLTILFAFLVARNIGLTIAQITDTATQIANGDFNRQVTIHTSDELQTLGQSFNQMTKNLRQYIIAEQDLRHEAEESRHQAEEAQAEAEAANRAKSVFLANMSHELRTPLNAILGFAQLIKRDTTLATVHRKQISIIHRSGTHLLDLLNDILAMSKIEAGHTVAENSNFNLYQLLKDITEAMSIRAMERDIHFVVTQSDNLPPYVHTDQKKLRQIILNLVSNAIKFTPPGGDVTVNVTYPQSNTLHIAVTDTGIGIPPEDIDRLFEAFYQTEHGRQNEQGTGLGLAISQQFVHLLGGQINVDSTVGQGTTFAFTAQITPVTSPTPQLNTAPRTIQSLSPGQAPYRILVAEDKWENRVLLAQLLQTIGFQVREAVNGQQAVDLTTKWKPHLIFMDMRMPIMSGYEATMQIRNQAQDVIIIALTASAFEQEREEILAAGCDDFITKPYQETYLLERIAHHLDLQYIYADDTPPDVSPPPAPINNEIDISQLPAALYQQLAEAAHTLRTSEIQRLLPKIEQFSPPLADKLSTLLNQFDFETIIDLITTTKE
ncbi:MAG TPA: ATP-binding protein [Anaerolineae bacterium]|nr:ATP-binding protein [Anaerolineae bacterium]